MHLLTYEALYVMHNIYIHQERFGWDLFHSQPDNNELTGSASDEATKDALRAAIAASRLTRPLQCSLAPNIGRALFYG